MNARRTECRKPNKCNNMARFRHGVLGNTKVGVHILVSLFAMASWSDIFGMWAELPLLTETAREGWALPAYFTIITQAANIGPILFLLVSYLVPQTKPKLEAVISFLVILLGIVACVMLAFLWDHTSYIGGTEHSTALLALNFVLALGDTTSSITFYAFMSRLKPEYMVSLLIGEGLSGLVPSMVALGQGAGEIKCNGTQAIITPPRFSIAVYFILMAVILAVSAIAFLLLNFWEYCQSEMVNQVYNNEMAIDPTNNSTVSYGALDNRDSQSEVFHDINLNIYKEVSEQAGPTNVQGTANCVSKETDNKENKNKRTNQIIRQIIQVDEIPLWKFFLCLVLIVLISLTLIVFLPSIQIYSSLPYGLEYYHLVTTLPQVANPIACVFALFVMTNSVVVILVMTVLGHVCVAYIIYLAAESPAPPLIGESEGGIISVAMWILVNILLIYVKVCVCGIMRKYGRTALIWVGASTQLGSLAGAIVGFLLVNEYKLFVEAPYCK